MRKSVTNFVITLMGSLLATTVCVQQTIAPQPCRSEGQPILSSQDSTGVTADQIVIGSCSALSGPAAQLGIQQLNGAKCYLNYVNEQGGINGRKLKLLTYDDGYEPEKAIAAFKNLLQDNCFAAAFFVGTPTAAKYVPMAETHGVPIVGLFTGAQLLQEPFRPHVMSVRASYFDETRDQIDTLFRDLGGKRVAVIYQDDAFGAAVLTGVKRALAKYAAQPVGLGSFQRNTVNVDDAIKDVKETHPDVVVMVGAYGALAEVVKRSHAQGFNPIFTTVSFVGTEAFIKAAGKDANGTVISQVMPPYTAEDKPTVVLYKKLLAKYFPKESPSFSSLEGFVDAMVLCEGIKAAGRDLTRSKMINALEGMHNRDVGLGNLKLTYGPNRHKAFNTVYLTEVRNGQPVAFTNWKELKRK